MSKVPFELSVELLLGDILEPEVTCQRTFVSFDTMFSIVKTVTKYLLSMYIMTTITYMINTHSKKNIFIYPLRKFTQLLRIENMCNYDDPLHLFGLLLMMIENDCKYRVYVLSLLQSQMTRYEWNKFTQHFLKIIQEVYFLIILKI